MLRYAVLALVGVVASSALAQPAPPQAGTPSPLSSSASVQPAQAVISMEDPLPGDHWTYEVRDEITGKITATRANIVTEVTPTEISTRFEILGTSNQGLNIYDRSWNLINSGPWRYSPNDGTGIQSRSRAARRGLFRPTTSTPGMDTSGTDRAVQKSSARKV